MPHKVSRYNVYPTNYNPDNEWQRYNVSHHILEVEDRGKGWVVKRIGMLLTKRGEWTYDKGGSHRDAAHMSSTRWKRAEDALAAAEAVVDGEPEYRRSWVADLEWARAQGVDVDAVGG